MTISYQNFFVYFSWNIHHVRHHCLSTLRVVVIVW